MTVKNAYDKVRQAYPDMKFGDCIISLTDYIFVEYDENKGKEISLESAFYDLEAVIVQKNNEKMEKVDIIEYTANNYIKYLISKKTTIEKLGL